MPEPHNTAVSNTALPPLLQLGLMTSGGPIPHETSRPAMIRDVGDETGRAGVKLLQPADQVRASVPDSNYLSGAFSPTQTRPLRRTRAVWRGCNLVWGPPLGWGSPVSPCFTVAAPPRCSARSALCAARISGYEGGRAASGSIELRSVRRVLKYVRERLGRILATLHVLSTVEQAHALWC